ncbi:MAG TPA: putative zinc-binding metallopeptidase, partial [Polyangiaceae bacterium]|nr:putative zinc-binding metallopeptidase [Polyangiaceae bacterium]
VEKDAELRERFRELFGDEREDYAEALQRHYARSPDAQWHDDFISEYASAHPWEDWAETWAHYMHMVDTFETAQHFGLVQAEVRVSLTGAQAPFELVLGNWMQLTIALNQLNRSMGLADPYPFDIGLKPGEKLAFVHDVIAKAAELASSTSNQRLDVHRDAQAV